MEKEFATPDIYPLSLNALTNACNQRSNRDPVVSASAEEVEAAVEELRLQKLAVSYSGGDARVQKFKHKVPEAFMVSEVERALLCELMVRGPQTAAGLRANSERLCAMPDAATIEALLCGLAQRGAGALVLKLPRLAGQKEARWTHLLSGEPALGGGEAEAEGLTVRVAIPEEVAKRLGDLEREVAELRATVLELKRELGITH